MKCPKCGSRKVAPIMYGMPAWSEELEKKINDKKIVLGGCCITGNDPKYHCFGCGKKIGYPAYYGDVVSVTFSKGGWGPPPPEVRMEDKSGTVTVTVSDAGEIKYRWEMGSREWKGLLKKLYEKFFLAEWKKKYIDPDVLDGEQWELEIGRKDGKKTTYYGSNAYPPYWEELDKLFQLYLEGRSAEMKDYAFLRFPGSMKIYNPWSDCTELTSMQKAGVYEMYKRFGLGTEILKKTGRRRNNTWFGKRMNDLERRMAELIESCSEEELKSAQTGFFGGDIITLSRRPWAKIWTGGELDGSGTMKTGPMYVSFDLKEAYNIYGGECRKHLTEEQKELLLAENPDLAALAGISCEGAK